MKTLNAYIFRRIAISTIAAVGLFTFVLLAGNAVKDLLGLLATGYLNWGTFFKFLFMLMPYVVSYALPLGMLTGVLLVLGKLSSDNEITAMRCAGLSLWQISAPIFAFAFMGSVAAMMVNNYYAPNAKSAYRQSLKQTLSKDPLKIIVEKTFIRDFKGRVIYIGEKDGNKMKDFWIWQMDEKRFVHQFIRAKSGEFSYDEEEDKLILTVFDGYAENRSKKKPNDMTSPLTGVNFKKGTINLNIGFASGRQTFHRKLSMLNFNDLILEHGRLERDEEMSADEKEEKMVRIQMQVQSNFSWAFSALSFAFIGIPLGIKVSRSETMANFVLALFLALGFYLLIIIVNWLEKRPDLRPDLLIWIPNFLFQGIGVWLFYRLGKR